MRCRTRLNANQARWQRSKEPQDVGSPQPLANDNRALVVDTVNLKDILCDIEADPDRGHGDLPLNNNAVPPILIRTGIGSSGGRPPHLDSKFQFRATLGSIAGLRDTRSRQSSGSHRSSFRLTSGERTWIRLPADGLRFQGFVAGLPAFIPLKARIYARATGSKRAARIRGSPCRFKRFEHHLTM